MKRRLCKRKKEKNARKTFDENNLVQTKLRKKERKKRKKK